jgi:putative ABC transport system permease protein
MATTIFGTTDVLQKMITINLEDKVYEVTAVIADVKANSHLFLSAIIPSGREHEFNLKSIVDPVEFVEASAMLYVRFSRPLDKDLDSKVESLLDRYVSKSDRLENGFRMSFQPIKDIYLGPHYRYEFSGKGNAIYVYAFSILAILLLIVAGINYINVSIADFSTRSRERGVRKVLGARRYQLITQILIEIQCHFSGTRINTALLVIPSNSSTIGFRPAT